VIVRGPRPTLAVTALEPVAELSQDARKGVRPAYFGEARGFVETPVFDRYRLALGAAVQGPAIIEERESTIIVGPDACAVVDAFHSVIVQLGDSQKRRITGTDRS